MTEKVRRWMEQENLIQAGDMVLAGVSGGADSVCLLAVLLKLRDSMGFSLKAVHVEHGIRGAESESDAAFVEALCESWEVPCETYHVDVPAYAKRAGAGVEEAARILRYECYKKAAACVTGVPVKVALAHHADDAAETILFQMARGSGLRGMCGMHAMREFAENSYIIRPLLGVNRAEIEQYLKKLGQTFCVDSTNQDMDYSRNRIRHKVIPELKKINTKAVSHIAQSAGLLQELLTFVSDETERVMTEVCSITDGQAEISQEFFTGCPVMIQKEVVHRILGETAGSRKDLERVHVEAVLGLSRLQVGRRISLPYQMVAERTYGGILIRREQMLAEEARGEYVIGMEQLARTEQEGGISLILPDGELRLRVFDFCGEMGEIQKKPYTKWLNYDKIKCDLQLRTRAGGDYLAIDEAGHTKKLKEYFIEEKVPRERRDKIWLLTEGAHVIWVVGGRISTGYKIRQDTKRILEVQMTGGNYSEDQED